MGIFDFLARRARNPDEIEAYKGETPPCPNCGIPLVKRFVYSEMYCLNCRCGLDDDDDDDDVSEALSVHDVAQIWASQGKDEDYMFGYSWEELEGAL